MVHVAYKLLMTFVLAQWCIIFVQVCVLSQCCKKFKLVLSSATGVFKLTPQVIQSTFILLANGKTLPVYGLRLITVTPTV